MGDVRPEFPTAFRSWLNADTFAVCSSVRKREVVQARVRRPLVTHRPRIDASRVMPATSKRSLEGRELSPAPPVNSE